jgi:hypothetical protein
MDWLDCVLVLYVACLAIPILIVGTAGLIQRHRQRQEDHLRFDAWMEGLAEGAGLDERDRREALHRRLRLDA